MALTSPARVGPTRAKADVERRLTGGGRDAAGTIFKYALIMALAISVMLLLILLLDQIVTGWDTLSGGLGSFLTGTLRSRPDDPAIGIWQGLWGTFWIGVFVVMIAFPIGIGAAIYLEEYAHRGRFTRFIDINVRNLAGVPSIVYGILGFAVFVKLFGDLTGGKTVVAAGLTLAVLVLPIVIITSAEAVRAVPGSLREAGFGVGATHWEVIKHHVLPYALPGILTGTVLSLARALGEAAPLILVGAVTGRLGTKADFFDVSALTDSFTAMPIVITTWAGRPQQEFQQLTAAAIVVLLVVVLLANTAAILLRNHFEAKRK